jgi:hypothetical protein
VSFFRIPLINFSNDQAFSSQHSLKIYRDYPASPLIKKSKKKNFGLKIKTVTFEDEESVKHQGEI